MKLMMKLVLILAFLTAAVRAEESKQEKQFWKAVASYQAAVQSHDMMATTRTQNEALRCWRLLTNEERWKAEEREPGTALWLEGGWASGGGGMDPRLEEETLETEAVTSEPALTTRAEAQAQLARVRAEQQARQARIQAEANARAARANGSRR